MTTTTRLALGRAALGERPHQGEEHAHRPPLLERREAIEAGRSKTVAETSDEAERASGSKRARRNGKLCLFIVVHRFEM